MTRVSQDLRRTLKQKIMLNLPAMDYASQAIEIAQQTLIAMAPPEVLSIFNSDEHRGYFREATIQVSNGNKNVFRGHVTLVSKDELDTWDEFVVRIDDVAFNHMKKGTVKHAVAEAIRESGLAQAHLNQVELRKSVESRLTANLEASKTFKQLYQNLEPALHHYIPKDEVRANLPSCVAPIVDDLRKLGAVLPETPVKEDLK